MAEHGFVYPTKPKKQAKPESTNMHSGTEQDRSGWGSWGAHDPALFKDPESGYYYTYCSGSGMRKSKDLITWEYIGEVITDIPAESKEFCGSDKPGSLAPDMIKVDKDYRLYSAAGTPPWGSHRSSLYVLSGKGPEGPFIPRGAVINSTNDDPLNAIDANPVVEVETGEHYLFYGSFWGGIFALHLNPRNGMAHETGFGKCVARRPKWADCAIEGPYVIHNADTGYYYLFVSYGSLKTDYNIRVGRSKHILGPYLDYNGRDLTDVEDFENKTGTMLVCGYKFDDSKGWMAPGHNSVLKDDDGSWYMAHHVRPYDFDNIDVFRQQIRKIVWSDDGWPLVSPECYAGEKQQPVTSALLVGHYEFIKLTPMTPQGVINFVRLDLLSPEMGGVSSTRNNWAMRVPGEIDGRVELGGSMRGWWKLTDANTLAIYYPNYTETYKILPAWDEENDCPTLVLTGLDDRGVACWAKKRDLPEEN